VAGAQRGDQRVLVDEFAARGLVAFGPSRAAARLEWSKAWTKELVLSRGIPTAAATVVESEASARAIAARVGLPVVLKADGLAGGKGVFVVWTPDQLESALGQLYGGDALGGAAEHVLVEEYLDGTELSVLAFTDGERLALMPPARDYKRLRNNDDGPNTGGMGGFTRPSYATADVLTQVRWRILEPTLAGMRALGQPYRGVLYAGLMLTSEGPRVLEFNCRFGDPECQLILPLLQSSLFETCSAIASGAFEPDQVRWREDRTYGVVLAASGYPEAPRIGDAIEGLDWLPAGVLVFHAGTRLETDGRIVTAGGRVMTVVGFERERVYTAAETIRFDGKQYRTDIALEGALASAR
jgi:phosphoribosylamine--glycine ligase